MYVLDPIGTIPSTRYGTGATSSSFRHQHVHSVPATITAHGLATSYVSVGAGYAPFAGGVSGSGGSTGNGASGGTDGGAGNAGVSSGGSSSGGGNGDSGNFGQNQSGGGSSSSGNGGGQAGK